MQPQARIGRSCQPDFNQNASSFLSFNPKHTLGEYASNQVFNGEAWR
jgi:hypothetical protein